MTYLEQIREEALKNAKSKVEEELKRKDAIIAQLKAQIERLPGNRPSDLSFS